jgi:L-alanine-DL-glutamate epimerase-like enolase superfamily enzyme
MPDGLITAVEVATIRSPLPVTINFGPWVMKHREFALCRIETDDGRVGTAFVYTRDGPLAEFVRLNIAPQYVGQAYDDPEALHWRAAWSNNAVLASGLGLRALSLVDLAAWDLAARAEGKSIAAYLGGELKPLPATAIIGYPPQLTPDEVTEQVSTLYEAGWRRFKQPIAATLDETRARLRAARAAMGPDCWLGMDCNWVFKSAQEAIDFARTIHDVDLGWMEDIVPPGNARMVAEIRKGAGLPVAMGDEQGGSYHPESLLAHQAVDVARVDVSTNGGITRLRRILDEIEASGTAFAPHMFGHVHSRVFAALGHTDVPIEWGVPGSGVDQFADSLPQPVIRDGLMEPLADEPGLGPQANPAWIAEQIVDDPDGVVERLA